MFIKLFKEQATVNNFLNSCLKTNEQNQIS